MSILFDWPMGTRNADDMGYPPPKPPEMPRDVHGRPFDPSATCIWNGMNGDRCSDPFCPRHGERGREVGK